MFTFSPDFENALGLLIEKKFKETLYQLLPEQTKPSKPQTRSGYLTKKQVCSHLNISLSGLNNYIKQGKIPKHRIGSRVLIKQSELDNLL